MLRQKVPTIGSLKMDVLQICFGLTVIIVAGFFVLMSFSYGIKWEIRPWLLGVFVVFCFMFAFAGFLLVQKGLAPPAKSPTTASDATPKEEDIYHVMWEGQTKDKKTLLLVEDSSGKVFYAKVSKILGIREVPVMAKEKFVELFPAPKEPAKTNK